MRVRVKTGATEPLKAYITDAEGDPLTGLTDVYVRIRRANGDYLDWDDYAFKAAGHVQEITGQVAGLPQAKGRAQATGQANSFRHTGLQLPTVGVDGFKCLLSTPA